VFELFVFPLGIGLPEIAKLEVRENELLALGAALHAFHLDVSVGAVFVIRAFLLGWHGGHGRGAEGGHFERGHGQRRQRRGVERGERWERWQGGQRGHAGEGREPHIGQTEVGQGRALEDSAEVEVEAIRHLGGLLGPLVVPSPSGLLVPVDDPMAELEPAGEFLFAVGED